MIGIVNAKINIGLDVVARREDGYHDLSTVFYPIGFNCGLPGNEEVFCDILEVIVREEPGFTFRQTGVEVDCLPDKNLVAKAASLLLEDNNVSHGVEIILDKHLPFGAGLGGGSADASFTLRLLNDALQLGLSKETLASYSLRLGADCPFFVYNTPCYGSGVGEMLEPVNIDLKGYWLVVVMPRVRVSTKDAFAGIIPCKPTFDLRRLPDVAIEDWRGLVKNDFETTIFAKFPELSDLKQVLYDNRAVYASLSGSGTAIYGIFRDKETAGFCRDELQSLSTVEHSYLLSL